jgi:hypothetical protein
MRRQQKHLLYAVDVQEDMPAAEMTHGCPLDSHARAGNPKKQDWVGAALPNKQTEAGHTIQHPAPNHTQMRHSQLGAQAALVVMLRCQTAYWTCQQQCYFCMSEVHISMVKRK